METTESSGGVSAIIINFNSQAFIKDCIKSLQKNLNGKADEIIVVDNNSTDESLDITKQYPEIKIVELAQNVGFGAGCNAGAKVAKGDILFFINPDAQLLTPLNNVRRIFHGDKNCGIVVPAVEIVGKLYSSIWRLPTIFGEFLGDLNILSRRYYLVKSKNDRPLVKIEKGQFASGTAMFIKKDLFNIVGGFDGKFFMYFEETDLFVRFHYKKINCYQDLSTAISHHGGGSLPSDQSYKKILRHYRSKKYYFSKYFPKSQFEVHRIITIVALLIKTIIRSIQSMFNQSARKRIGAYVESIKIYCS